MGEFPSIPGNGDFSEFKPSAAERRRRLLKSMKLKPPIFGEAEQIRNSPDGMARRGGLQGFRKRMEKRQVLTREHVEGWPPICHEEFPRAECAGRIEKALELLQQDLWLDDARQHESTQAEDILVRASRILGGTMSLMNMATDHTDLDRRNKNLPYHSFITLVRTVTNIEELSVPLEDPETWLAERNTIIMAADVAADYFVMADIWQGLE